MADLTKYPRPPYKDCVISIPGFRADGWTVELKHDGMWCYLVVDNPDSGIAYPYSDNDTRKSGEFHVRTGFTGVFIGEYMFGSNWAYRHNQTGQIHLYDIVEFNGVSLVDLPLSRRRKYLSNAFHQHMEGLENGNNIIHLTEVYLASMVDTLWKHYVDGNDYEGIVFKNENDTYPTCTWHRAKKVFTLDYVCMGFHEGGGKNVGRVGSILCGLYFGTELRMVCSVGTGLTDIQRIEMWNNQPAYVGKVLEASGWKVFPSGALRHPAFLRWRDDKKPEWCILPAQD